MGDGLRDIFDPRLQAEPAMSLLAVTGPEARSIGGTPILRGIDLCGRAGRDPRHHRRIRLRQVDDRAVDHAAAAGGRACQRPRSRSTASSCSPKSEREMCAIRGKDIGMVFQEPMTALDPLKTIGDQVAETVLTHTQTSRARSARRGRPRHARPRRPAGATGFRSTAIPHELSRRPAPARRHRHGHRAAGRGC